MIYVGRFPVSKWGLIKDDIASFLLIRRSWYVFPVLVFPLEILTGTKRSWFLF